MRYTDLGRYRRPALVVALVTAVTLAWSGLLDASSANYLDGALLGSGAIYATARSINALVSVLQGTEVDALLVTFTVGELLDPINDLIERFSGLMLLAMGSLALQKILLEVVSHGVFNALLTALACATLIALWSGQARLYAGMSRFLIMTIALRFSMTLMVLASAWADTVFLKEQDVQRHASVRAFEGELERIGSSAGLNLAVDPDMEQTRAAIASNLQAARSEQAALVELQQALVAEENLLKELDQRSLLDRLLEDSSTEVAAKEAEISSLRQAVEDREQYLAALNGNRKALENRLQCQQRQSRGENCSLGASVVQTFGALDVSTQIRALEDKVSEFSANLVNLLMSTLLKSVILPMVFFYLLLRLTRRLL